VVVTTTAMVVMVDGNVGNGAESGGHGGVTDIML
jgi:hypothetical protein